MKPTKVVFLEESLQESFENLSKEDPVRKALINAIKEIKKDAFLGRNVKKKLMPKKLIKKYSINNLWIYNLPKGWRMLYSITSTGEVEIIAAVLDWMTHKEYERLFKF